jgi:hypothetical protein
MDRLPEDLLVNILEHLPARSLCRATCVSRPFAAAAARVGCLRVAVGARAPLQLREWLASDAVAPKVVSLTARRSMYTHCGWLRRLVNIELIDVAHCLLRPAVLGHIATLVNLKTLALHRIFPLGAFDTFHTKVFQPLVNLETLRITLAPFWETAIVDGLPPALTLLSLRNATTLVVRDTPEVADITLRAYEALLFVEPLGQGCEAVDLECAATPVRLHRAFDKSLFFGGEFGVKRLRVSAPNAAGMSPLAALPALETVDLDYDDFVYSAVEVRALRSLRSLSVNARQTFSILDSGPLPPALRARLTMAGQVLPALLVGA